MLHYTERKNRTQYESCESETTILRFFKNYAIIALEKGAEKEAAAMSSELEVVVYEKLRHVKVFLNRIIYRNFHMHSAFELLLVLDGSGRLNLHGSTIGLEPGSLVLLNPQEPHEIQSGSEAVSTVVFQVSQQFCREYSPVFQNIRFQEADLSAFMGETPSLYRRCCGLICEASLEYLEAGPGFELKCISHITELFWLLFQNIPHQILSDHERTNRKRKVRRVSRIADYLDENYLTQVRLQELADLEGLTPTYISHLFSEYFGVSFQKYLSNLRFEKAVMLLRNTEFSQAEIAAESGFSDPKYFAQMFRQRMGCSFHEYRSNPEVKARFHAGIAANASLLEYQYPPEDSIRPISDFLGICRQEAAPESRAGSPPEQR